MPIYDKKRKSASGLSEEATDGCEKASRSFRLADIESEDPPAKRSVKREKAQTAYEDEAETTSPKSRSKPKERDREEKDAFRAALPILSSGANSARMVREKLIRKGYSAAQAQKAVKEAKEAGLLNDRRLLEAHAVYLATRKYYGRARIRLALLQKFDREVVEAYFDASLEDVDFYELARSLATHFSPRGREYVIGKLKRAGFSVSEIRSALEGVSFSEENED